MIETLQVVLISVVSGRSGAEGGDGLGVAAVNQTRAEGIGDFERDVALDIARVVGIALEAARP